MKGRPVPILKASGKVDLFSPARLRSSLQRSGAPPQLAEEIVREVSEGIYPDIPTNEIYRTAYKLLKSRTRQVAGRYKLKRAIMELGPSGFPFEQYVAHILQEQGYRVATGVIVRGHCVNHEVDVIAEKDSSQIMVECKYHNSPGKVSDVKVPLYINSRFQDVESAWRKLPGNLGKTYQGWVVTNTRFTADAITYGECAGLHLVGWNYPPKGSLNQLIEKMKLLPVTCLSTLSASEKQGLLTKKIVLCREIVANPATLLQIGIKESRVKNIVSEANQLIL